MISCQIDHKMSCYNVLVLFRAQRQFKYCLQLFADYINSSYISQRFTSLGLLHQLLFKMFILISFSEYLSVCLSVCAQFGMAFDRVNFINLISLTRLSREKDLREDNLKPGFSLGK